MVTMIVAGVWPSAGTADGLAPMPALAAIGTTNATCGFCATVTPSVVSVAVKVTISLLRSVTVNTADPPSGDVTAVDGVMTA